MVRALSIVLALGGLVGAASGATPAWAQAAPEVLSAATGLSEDMSTEQAWQQAQQAITQNDWPRAELWLERVLMLAPHRADAMLELARVLQRQGRLHAAHALLQTLVADPRTPAPHRRQLQSWLADIEFAAAGGAPPTATPVQSTWTWYAGLALGHHSNPMGLTSAAELTLTLPDGPLRLPLASRPRPGALAVVELGAEQTLGARWHAQWTHADLSAARSAWRLHASWPLPPSWWPSRAWLQMGDQRTLDGGRRSTALAAFVLSGPNAAVDRQPVMVIGLYREATRRGPLLRWQIAPLGAGGGTAAPNADIWAELELAARPQPDLLRAGASLQWRPRANLVLGAGLQAHLDLQGYSPWLADGAPRRLVSADVHGTWTVWTAADGTAALLLTAGAFRRVANLQPWSMRGAYIQLQWRQAWR